MRITSYFQLFLFVVILFSCGYKVLSVQERLKGYSIKLNKVKNLTPEYGAELELIKVLHKRFLSNGIKIKTESEDAEYEINANINSIQFIPLSYRQGINVAYSYEYECRVSVGFEFVSLSDSSKKRLFSITESSYYFSADSPATTESNKRLAIIKVFNTISDRFIRELTLGIQGI